MVVKISPAHRRANIRADWKNKIKYLFYWHVLCRIDGHPCTLCNDLSRCTRYLNKGWFD